MTLKCNSSSEPLEYVLECKFQCVGGRNEYLKAFDVSEREMLVSADLGSSSSYSNE